MSRKDGAKLPHEEYLARASLLKRGWTDTLIAQYLIKHDLQKPNPRYRSAPPMKLYLLARVERIEATPEFQEAREKASRRKQSSQKAVSTKRSRTLRYVEEQVDIKVPHLSNQELIRRACDNYNDRKLDYDYIEDFASESSDPLFLQRIMVNYLRHKMTEYEQHLDEVKGRVGIQEAYLGIRKKVLDAIAGVYPWLAEECERQWQYKLEMMEMRDRMLEQ